MSRRRTRAEQCHRLYYWPFLNLTEVGHVSLELTDGTYISHWPMNRKSSIPVNFGQLVSQKPASQQPDLASDIRDEEGRQPTTLKIPVALLDTAKIKSWRAAVLNDPDKNKYNIRKKNCAHFAAKAIQQGLVTKNPAHLQPFDWSILKLPEEVYRAMREIVQLYDLFESRPSSQGQSSMTMNAGGSEEEIIMDNETKLWLASLVNDYVRSMTYFDQRHKSALYSVSEYGKLAENHLAAKRSSLERLQREISAKDKSGGDQIRKELEMVLLKHISGWFTFFTMHVTEAYWSVTTSSTSTNETVAVTQESNAEAENDDTIDSTQTQAQEEAEEAERCRRFKVDLERNMFQAYLAEQQTKENRKGPAKLFLNEMKENAAFIAGAVAVTVAVVAVGILAGPQIATFLGLCSAGAGGKEASGSGDDEGTLRNFRNPRNEQEEARLRMEEFERLRREEEAKRQIQLYAVEAWRREEKERQLERERRIEEQRRRNLETEEERLKKLFEREREAAEDAAREEKNRIARAAAIAEMQRTLPSFFAEELDCEILRDLDLYNVDSGSSGDCAASPVDRGLSLFRRLILGHGLESVGSGGQYVRRVILNVQRI